jgi:hypothetical protein
MNFTVDEVNRRKIIEGNKGVNARKTVKKTSSSDYNMISYERNMAKHLKAGERRQAVITLLTCHPKVTVLDTPTATKMIEEFSKKNKIKIEKNISYSVRSILARLKRTELSKYMTITKRVWKDGNWKIPTYKIIKEYRAVLTLKDTLELSKFRSNTPKVEPNLEVLKPKDVIEAPVKIEAPAKPDSGNGTDKDSENKGLGFDNLQTVKEKLGKIVKDKNLTLNFNGPITINVYRE